MSYAVPTRAEIPDADKWDLTQLFANVSKWQEDFTWLQREYPKLEQWKGRVGESAQSLAAVLEFEKRLELKMERIHHYASLQLSEDSTNNEYLARIAQVQNLFTRIGESAASAIPNYASAPFTSSTLNFKIISTHSPRHLHIRSRRMRFVPGQGTIHRRSKLPCFQMMCRSQSMTD